jgi:hypothetical protein
MGAYTTLRLTSPTTGEEIDVNFKHGRDFQRMYRIGDTIDVFLDDYEEQQREFGGAVEPPCSPEELEYCRVIVKGGRIIGIEIISEAEFDRMTGLW